MSTNTEAVEPQSAEEVEAGEEMLDNEIERILPNPGDPVELEDGSLVVIRPLKVKELFAAFKIITRGSAMSMGALNMGIFNSQGEFADTLIALLIHAIPEADAEFAEFLRVIVDPYVEGGKWESREAQLEAEAHLDEILADNPDILDAVAIISAMVYAESRDIERLGKRIQAAVGLFAKTNLPK